jgi:hypothetical protein
VPLLTDMRLLLSPGIPAVPTRSAAPKRERTRTNVEAPGGGDCARGSAGGLEKECWLERRFLEENEPIDDEGCGY